MIFDITRNYIASNGYWIRLLEITDGSQGVKNGGGTRKKKTNA